MPTFTDHFSKILFAAPRGNQFIHSSTQRNAKIRRTQKHSLQLRPPGVCVLPHTQHRRAKATCSSNTTPHKTHEGRGGVQGRREEEKGEEWRGKREERGRRRNTPFRHRSTHEPGKETNTSDVRIDVTQRVTTTCSAIAENGERVLPPPRPRSH